MLFLFSWALGILFHNYPRARSVVYSVNVNTEGRGNRQYSMVFILFPQEKGRIYNREIITAVFERSRLMKWSIFFHEGVPGLCLC